MEDEDYEIVPHIEVIKLKKQLEELKAGSGSDMKKPMEELTNSMNKMNDILKEASSSILDPEDPLYKALYDVNCDLWTIEDHIRDLEGKKDFGDAHQDAIHPTAIIARCQTNE